MEPPVRIELTTPGLQVLPSILFDKNCEQRKVVHVLELTLRN